jgi:hypothetical protein
MLEAAGERRGVALDEFLPGALAALGSGFAAIGFEDVADSGYGNGSQAELF